MGLISHQLVPPGGWQFKQGDIIIKGSTWDELVKFVKDHRRSNGIEVRDVVDEIDTQIADKFPQLIIGFKL